MQPIIIIIIIYCIFYILLWIHIVFKVFRWHITQLTNKTEIKSVKNGTSSHIKNIDYTNKCQEQQDSLTTHTQSTPQP
jgi:hypothetical protein